MSAKEQKSFNEDLVGEALPDVSLLLLVVVQTRINSVENCSFSVVVPVLSFPSIFRNKNNIISRYREQRGIVYVATTLISND